MTEERYLLEEVFMATGMSVNTLHRYRRKQGIEPNRDGYTMREVHRILRCPHGKPRNRTMLASRAKARKLREQLRTDGYLPTVGGGRGRV